MPRHLNLRQIEAFKAVIENGTVSRGAEMLNISQPAMSKLIAHLEADTGLNLFDRLKGRLAPTEHAMRLYDEIDRIFAGVRQVENAVDAIRREEQGRLAVGVMPALAGPFIQQATLGFLANRGNVFCSVQSLSSQWILDRLVARKLDIGLVSARNDNPYLTFEPLMEHPLVCIMPPDHPLAANDHVTPEDLDEVPFLSFSPDTHVGYLIEEMFIARGIRPRIVLTSNVAPTLCEFAAAGLGLSLLHPLTLGGQEHRLAVRRFEPAIPYSFKLCRSADTRNARLVEAFAAEVRAAADAVSRAVLSRT